MSVNLEDFGGADPTGAINNTTLLQSVVSAHKVTKVHEGNWWIDSLVIPQGHVVKCEAKQAVTFWTHSPTATHLTFTGQEGHFSGARLKPAVTRTGGKAVYMGPDCSHCEFDDFIMQGFPEGLVYEPNADCHVTRGRIDQIPHNGIGLRINGGFAGRMRELLLGSADPANPSWANIVVSHCADMTWEYIHSIYSRQPLYVAPGTGQEVDSLTGTNCLFDVPLPGHAAVTITPQGTGLVQRSGFTSLWASAGANLGKSIHARAGTPENPHSRISGLTLASAFLAPNLQGDGTGILAENVEGLILNGAQAAGHHVGAHLLNCSGVGVGNVIGPTNGFGPNNHGARLEGPYSTFQMDPDANHVKNNVYSDILRVP